jgi:2-methylisocitrate lyase-like PEP mutase family enzyme
MRLAMKAVDDGLAALKRDGGFEPSLVRMQSRKELYELLQYKPGDQWNFPRG